MSDLQFIPYAGNHGHVYFGDEQLGLAERTGNNLYIPSQSRSARTLIDCALKLASKNAAKAKKEYVAAQRIVSAIAAIAKATGAGGAMKTSAQLYAAADYLRRHGFRYELGSHSRDRCMIGALESVGGVDWGLRGAAREELERVTGDSLDASYLRSAGWTKEDAIAALEIAADYASAEGR